VHAAAATANAHDFVSGFPEQVRVGVRVRVRVGVRVRVRP